MNVTEPIATERESLIKRSIKSVVFMTGAMAAGLVISTVGRFVLAAQLEPDIFGNFTVALAFVGFLLLPVNTLGDRLIIVTTHDRRRTVNTVFTVELSLWLLIVSLWLGFSRPLWARVGGEMSWWLVSVLLLQGLALPLGRARALFERDLNFRVVSVVNVSAQLIAVAVAIALSFRHKTELPLVVSSLVVLAQSAIFATLGGVRPRLEVDTQVLRQYAALCLPLMASAGLVYLTWNGDRLLLDRYVSREAIGHYGLAFSLGAVVLRMKDGLTSVFFPVFSSLLREKRMNEVKKGLVLIYRALGLFYGFLVPLMVFLAPYVARAIGPEWSNASACLQIAILVFTFRTLNSFLEPVLVAYERSHVLLIFTISNSAFVLICGYIALNLRPGIETMAGVVLLSTAGTFVGCASVIRFLTGVSMAAIVAPVAVWGGLFAGIMWTLRTLYGAEPAVLAMTVAAGTIVFTAGVWRHGRDLFAEIHRGWAASA